jgi:hypothetical protein
MIKRLTQHLSVALVITLLSSAFPYEVLQVREGSDYCSKGCRLIAASWPITYLVDGYGRSPAGSVHLLMGLTGDDDLFIGLMGIDILLWLIVSLSLHSLWQRKACTKEHH